MENMREKWGKYEGGKSKIWKIGGKDEGKMREVRVKYGKYEGKMRERGGKEEGKMREKWGRISNGEKMYTRLK